MPDEGVTPKKNPEVTIPAAIKTLEEGTVWV
jgi:hypothetical protein